jgi:hypothetical protein
MRSFAPKIPAAAIAALAVATAVGAGESHVLAYKFTEGGKSTYALGITLDITTTAEQGGQKQVSTARTKKLDLAMDVVERPAKEGVRAAPELGVTFRDLVLEQELSGAAGDVTLEIEGGEVVARRSGSVIIDTKKGKNKELAAAILAEFAFVGKEGTLTVRESGRVTKVDGPDAFKAFLSAESGAGLWVLETKASSVAAGETWAAEERRIRSFRGLDVSTNPIKVNVSYTLEGFEEREGRKVAKIKVKSELARGRNLTGNVTGEALKGARVDIRKLERTAEGTVLFDIDAGRLIESDIHVTLDVEVEMTIKDKRTKKDVVVKTKVEGTGRAVMKLQPPAPAAAKDAAE